MIKYILLVLQIVSFHALGLKAQSSSHLMVRTVKVNGYDCYCTSFFEVFPSRSEIQGKILYMPDARYIKNQSTLTFMFKDDGNPLVSKLKELKNGASKSNLFIKMVAEPESFHVCSEPDILSCVGVAWDGYEECPVVYIKFPLAYCVTEKQRKHKKRCKYFKEILKKSKFEKICVVSGNNSIEIPIEFPLNETLCEMEKLSVNNK